MSAKKVVKTRRKQNRIKASDGVRPFERKYGPPANAFPLHNTLWQQRKKHGRDKTFASPLALLQVFEEYEQWCIANPPKSTEKASYAGVPTTQEIPLRRALTIGAFCLYAGADEDFLKNFLLRLQGKTDKESADFVAVINEIKRYVEEDMKEGALTGQFNANIASRLLGLVEKSDVTTGGERLQTTMPELTIKIESNTPGFANAEAEVKDKKK